MDECLEELFSDISQYRDEYDECIDLMEVNDDCEHQNKEEPALTSIHVRADQLTSLSSSGMVARGALGRLLSPRSVSDGMHSQLVKSYFGCVFVLSQLAAGEAWTELTRLLRKHLMNLEERTNEQMTADMYIEFNCKAKTILKVLQDLELYIQNYLVNDHPGDLQKRNMTSILSSLRGLCSQLHCLHGYSQSGCSRQWCPIGSGNATSSVGETMLVLQTYIRWLTLSSLYRLRTHCEEASRMCILYLNHVLKELVAMGMDIFNGSIERDTGSLVPYPSECLLELWLLVMHLKDKMALEARVKTFWESLIPALSADDEDDEEDVMLESPFQALEKQTSHDFVWWMISSLAPLYCYHSNTGVLHNNIEALNFSRADGWQVVQDLLMTRLLQCNSSLDQLCCPLQCLVKLALLWPPNVRVVLMCWDSLHKSLDHSSLPSPTPGHHAACLTSPSQMVSLIKQIASLTDTREVSTALKGAPWFCHFLSLLCVTFEKMKACGLFPWREVKGKFLSKVHRKWLIDLNSTGLGNAVLLFLALTWSGDLQDVSGRMVTLLVSLGPTHASCKNGDFIWAGLFAVLQMYLLKGEDPSRLLEQISSLLGELSAAFKPTSVTAGLFQKSVAVILKAVLEIFQEPSLSVSCVQTTLFSQPLCQLVGCLVTTGGLSSAIEWMSSILQSFSQQISRLSDKMIYSSTEEESSSGLRRCVQRYFNEVLPSLYSAAQSDCNSLCSVKTSMVSLAIALTDFCLQHNSFVPETGEYFYKVIESLGLHSQVPATLAATVLSHVLKEEQKCRLFTSTEQAQLQTLHTWVRCIIEMHRPPGAEDDVKILSNNILKLPLVHPLIKKRDITSLTSEKPLTVLKYILVSMNEEMIKSHTTVWYQRGNVIFEDFMKYIDVGLSGGFPPKVMDTTFAVGAAVVRCSPQLIYSRSEVRCLLPRLVDLLASNPRKPVTASISIRIKHSLHHFIQGLLLLDPQRDDFIKRKLKQLFGKYFLAYCQQDQPNPLMRSTANPFTTLVSPTFKPSPKMESVCALMFVLECIATQQLKPPLQHTNILPVLLYIENVFKQIQNSELLARSGVVVFPSLLACLHHCECSLQAQSSEYLKIRKLATDILRRVLIAQEKSCGIVQVSQVHEAIREYTEQHLRNNSRAVFKPLHLLIALSHDLVEHFLPIAWNVIEKNERERGVGNDTILRSAYQGLVEEVSRRK